MAHDEERTKQPRSFEALTPELSQWIIDFTTSMGFSRTTPVQGMAIPLLMGNKDLVVEAVTGSGKTLSFLIPIVERLLKAEEPNKKGYVRSIVIAPTKELARQIYDVFRGLLQFHATSAARSRPHDSLRAPDSDDGMDYENGEDSLLIPPGPHIMPQLLTGGRTKLNEDLATFSETNPNVLIGTPKRLLEVLQSSRVVLKRHWFDLLVLDEADRLLDPNFQADLQRILEAVPKERRTALFSASVSEAVNELVKVGMRYPFKISAKVRSKSGALDKKTPESLKLWHITTKPRHKLPILRRIVAEQKVDKAILYVSTRAGVDYWYHVLPTLLSMAIFPLHGDHNAAIRTKNLRKFRDATSPAILLTTDVLARGIDIPDVDLVIQFDPPSQPKDFIHRCGRSGRAGRKGMAITFLSEGSEEDYVKFLGIQGTTLEPFPNLPEIDETDAAMVVAQIRDVLMRKRELHDRSQKAFVSWVQAYTKTLPSDVFNVRNIDWTEVGQAWGLLCWPKMPEIRRQLPTAYNDRTFGLALSTSLDLDSLPYADPIREERRQALLAALAKGDRSLLPKKSSKGVAADKTRRKEHAWSDQKEVKATKEARREKKEVRRKAEKQSNMSEADKARQIELDDLVKKVRAQNAARAAQDSEDFEGFED